MQAIPGSKWRKQEADVTVCLASFEKAQEWADLAICLQRLQKLVAREPQEACTPVPTLIMIVRTLSRCLKAQLPSGIHTRTLRVFEAIFDRVGPQSLPSILPCCLQGLQTFYPGASSGVKSVYASLYKSHFIPILGDLPAIASDLLACIVVSGEDERCPEFSFFSSFVALYEETFGWHRLERDLWKIAASLPTHRLGALQTIYRRAEGHNRADARDDLGEITNSICCCLLPSHPTLQKPELTLLTCRAALDTLQRTIDIKALAEPHRMRLLSFLLCMLLTEDDSIQQRTQMCMSLHDAEMYEAVMNQMENFFQGLTDHESENFSVLRCWASTLSEHPLVCILRLLRNLTYEPMRDRRTSLVSVDEVCSQLDTDRRHNDFTWQDRLLIPLIRSYSKEFGCDHCACHFLGERQEEESMQRERRLALESIWEIFGFGDGKDAEQIRIAVSWLIHDLLDKFHCGLGSGAVCVSGSGLLEVCGALYFEMIPPVREPLPSCSATISEVEEGSPECVSPREPPLRLMFQLTLLLLRVLNECGNDLCSQLDESAPLAKEIVDTWLQLYRLSQKLFKACKSRSSLFTPDSPMREDWIPTWPRVDPHRPGTVYLDFIVKAASIPDMVNELTHCDPSGLREWMFNSLALACNGSDDEWEMWYALAFRGRCLMENQLPMEEIEKITQRRWAMSLLEARKGDAQCLCTTSSLGCIVHISKFILSCVEDAYRADDERFDILLRNLWRAAQLTREANHAARAELEASMSRLVVSFYVTLHENEETKRPAAVRQRKSLREFLSSQIHESLERKSFFLLIFFSALLLPQVPEKLVRDFAEFIRRQGADLPRLFLQRVDESDQLSSPLLIHRLLSQAVTQLECGSLTYEKEAAFMELLRAIFENQELKRFGFQRETYCHLSDRILAHHLQRAEQNRLASSLESLQLFGLLYSGGNAAEVTEPLVSDLTCLTIADLSNTTPSEEGYQGRMKLVDSLVQWTRENVYDRATSPTSSASWIHRALAASLSVCLTRLPYEEVNGKDKTDLVRLIEAISELIVDLVRNTRRERDRALLTLATSLAKYNSASIHEILMPRFISMLRLHTSNLMFESPRSHRLSHEARMFNLKSLASPLCPVIPADVSVDLKENAGTVIVSPPSPPTELSPMTLITPVIDASFFAQSAPMHLKELRNECLTLLWESSPYELIGALANTLSMMTVAGSANERREFVSVLLRVRGFNLQLFWDKAIQILNDVSDQLTDKVRTRHAAVLLLLHTVTHMAEIESHELMILWDHLKALMKTILKNHLDQTCLIFWTFDLFILFCQAASHQSIDWKVWAGAKDTVSAVINTTVSLVNRTLKPPSLGQVDLLPPHSPTCCHVEKLLHQSINWGAFDESDARRASGGWRVVKPSLITVQKRKNKIPTDRTLDDGSSLKSDELALVAELTSSTAPADILSQMAIGSLWAFSAYISQLWSVSSPAAFALTELLTSNSLPTTIIAKGIQTSGLKSCSGSSYMSLRCLEELLTVCLSILSQPNESSKARAGGDKGAQVVMASISQLALAAQNFAGRHIKSLRDQLLVPATISNRDRRSTRAANRILILVLMIVELRKLNYILPPERIARRESLQLTSSPNELLQSESTGDTERAFKAIVNSMWGTLCGDLDVVLPIPSLGFFSSWATEVALRVTYMRTLTSLVMTLPRESVLPEIETYVAKLSEIARFAQQAAPHATDLKKILCVCLRGLLASSFSAPVDSSLWSFLSAEIYGIFQPYVAPLMERGETDEINRSDVSCETIMAALKVCDVISLLEPVLPVRVLSRVFPEMGSGSLLEDLWTALRRMESPDVVQTEAFVPLPFSPEGGETLTLTPFIKCDHSPGLCTLINTIPQLAGVHIYRSENRSLPINIDRLHESFEEDLSTLPGGLSDWSWDTALIFSV